MTQQQVRTFIASGVVPPCRNCRQLPRHFVDLRKPAAGGGHFFECCAGATRTARHPTPELTNQEWCQRNGVTQRPAAARASVSHIARNHG